ncbi:DUF3784 domain-containing protein [Scatolibacter rhodanostii]|uniref:DUF3784 domain-containing protein n=1 Tax=Scatolibacter rhodanostii TaxID=2014781 RepID=UPI000C08023C|nr:DUF3784 domain-containing protein [Scatolibacter rhodanostii]
MNIGLIICLLMAGAFLMLAAIFALLKERAATLISGFNSLSLQEQKQYDRLKMSNNMRNSFLVWFILFIAGAILSYFVSPYAAAGSFLIWLFLVFKEIHLDAEKAFERYKL